jgi:hypothetical protein
MTEKEIRLISQTPEGGKVYEAVHVPTPVTPETLRAKFFKFSNGKSLTPAMELLGDFITFFEQQVSSPTAPQVAPALPTSEGSEAKESASESDAPKREQ